MVTSDFSVGDIVIRVDYRRYRITRIDRSGDEVVVGGVNMYTGGNATLRVDEIVYRSQKVG